MTQVNVSLGGEIAPTNSGATDAEATIVGSPPVWLDDSDATYVELDGSYNGPGAPAFFSQAQCEIEAQELAGLEPTNPEFRCHMSIRLSGVQAGLPFPDVVIESSDSSLSPISSPPCPDAPEWVQVEMVGSLAQLWDRPDTFNIQISATTIDPAPEGIRSWRIYEVRLFFEIKRHIVTTRRKFPVPPPGRHYPRSSIRGRGRHGPESHI